MIYFGFAVLLTSLVMSVCLAATSYHAYQMGNMETKYNNFKVASYFGSNMVLQRAPRKASIWGYADLSDLDKTVRVKIVDQYNVVKQVAKGVVYKGPFSSVGVWRVVFDPVEEKGPFEIHYQLDSATFLNKNVLFGDVYVCSGQSNMVFRIDWGFNVSQIMKDAVNHPDVRLLKASRCRSDIPLHDLKRIEIPWTQPIPETLGNFSEVCYLYGTIINKKMGVPVGLIDSAVGGTPIEAWSSPKALHYCGIKSLLRLWKKRSETDHSHCYGPTTSDEMRFYSQDPFSKRTSWPNNVLWNAMIHPLKNITLFGVLWYQGESNAGNNRDKYNCTFPALIKDWRENFYDGSEGINDPQFPFGFVQIGPNSVNTSIISGMCDIRWHQTEDKGYTSINNTFMAVSVDLTDNTSPYGSIHYRDKNTTAHRLALGGLAVAYRQTGLRHRGPLPISQKTNSTDYTFTIQYDGGPIFIKDASAANGFEICCAHNNQSRCGMDDYNWIRVPIISWDSHSVTLSFKSCSNMYVMGWRYIWRETPCEYKSCPVYSQESLLPAPPYIFQGLVNTNNCQ